MSDHKHIEKIKPEILLLLAKEVLDQSVEFKYISGVQPFFMSFDNEEFFVYIKNISSAYFTDRDQTTRAQLPIKKEFEVAKNSDKPFIFLGYDGANDVYVCWNYHIVKQRLNISKSVSFYSRTFFQSEVKEGEFNRRQLKNGDIPVLFKRSNLIEFFKNVHSFFPDDNLNDPEVKIDLQIEDLEEKFSEFLRDVKKLSNDLILYYCNVLNGPVTDIIAKYFYKNITSFYQITRRSELDKLEIDLTSTPEYQNLNEIERSIYISVLTSYIEFFSNMMENKSDCQKQVADVDVKSDKKLKCITDFDLLTKLKPYVESNRLLSAAQIVGEHYKNQYPNMQFKDWMELINEIK
ncbi:hypothetical protein [Chryseobacterium cucumeris]|uniref:hypothetical protein n=1 Tax=Chryseobacterium cucumeris TaxID=1813611 RepID=UPI001F4A3EDB|nr:hypothetical protein [Chryseobacterium cucumeris]